MRQHVERVGAATGISRRDFMTSATASLAIGALACPSFAQQPRTLIKGGVVLSFDRNIGDFENADVLIEGSKIAAVRPNISADAAVIDASNTIVLPGFIDSHHHFYQSALRNVLPNGVLADYFRDISGAATSEYRVEDAYVGNLIGALRSIDAGITTVTDLSQVSNTPEHSDALIKGLKDSGIRAVYAYSRGSGPGAKYPGDAERIWVNISAAIVVSTSLDRLGRMPTSSACWIGGMPWRMAISIGQAMESHPPVSFTRRICSLVALVKWIYTLSPPISPSTPSFITSSGPIPRLPPTTWVKMRSPNRRASSHCSLLIAVPRAIVTSWSVDPKCRLRMRSASPGYFEPGPEPRE